MRRWGLFLGGLPGGGGVEAEDTAGRAEEGLCEPRQELRILSGGKWRVRVKAQPAQAWGGAVEG